ncbi:MAG: cell division topological specificity factor MinE [Clostridia bacterium]|nr:cell division topological specificity factor MinE [Clostridia bacterium]
MMEFFNRLFPRNKSKNVAKERLKLVLMGDRGVSPEVLEKIKGEIIGVLSKYIEIEDNELDFKIANTENEDGTAIVPALVANIPIRRIKK